MKMAELPGKIYKPLDINPTKSRPGRTNPYYYAAGQLEIGESLLIPQGNSCFMHRVRRATGFDFTRVLEGQHYRFTRIA